MEESDYEVNKYNNTNTEDFDVDCEDISPLEKEEKHPVEQNYVSQGTQGS